MLVECRILIGHHRFAELIRIVSGTKALVRDPDGSDPLVAHGSFDMWSLGALLYHLITGQTLFHNDQEDNLNNQDLIRLSKWSDSALKTALTEVHDPKRGKKQPLGRDLLEKLLQPDAVNRPQAFDEVLGHPFFVGESSAELEEEITKLKAQLSGKMQHVMAELKQAKEDAAAAQQATGAAQEEALARVQKLEARMKQQAEEELRKEKEREASASSTQEILKRLEEIEITTQLVAATTARVEKEQKRQTQLLETIKERTIRIEEISYQTYEQLRKTEQVLLRSMFEATEVTMPTSFVIMPSKIEPKGPSPTAGPAIKLAEDGSGVELGAVGKELKDKFVKRKGWFDKVCELGTSIATG
jgi:hypothetical protein